MRPVTIVAFLLAAPLARADWLIDIPTGRKITLNNYHCEWRGESRAGGFSETRLGFGLTSAIEATVRTQALARSGPTVGALDLSYALVPPVPGITPGICGGLLDAGSNTQDGRRAFVAMTFREDFDSDHGTLLADVTIGLFLGHHAGGFVGAQIPLAKNFHFVAEHNGIRVSGGVEYLFAPRLAFRLIERDRSMLLGLSFASRF